MNTLRSTMVGAALLAAMSSLSFAATDVYLKLEGIDGEAKPRTAPAPIEISSFSFGASNAGSVQKSSGLGAGKASMSDLSATAVVSPRDAASGLPTGKRMHKPAAPDVKTVSVVLPAAESDTSRALDRACANGTHIKNAELSSSAQRVSLADVVVSSCASSARERRYEFRGHVTLLK